MNSLLRIGLATRIGRGTSDWLAFAQLVRF